jgi:hypothetical protein
MSGHSVRAIFKRASVWSKSEVELSETSDEKPPRGDSGYTFEGGPQKS